MPEPFALAGDMVDEVAAIKPSVATLLGVPGHDHRWDDLSPEGYEGFADLARRQRTEMSPHLDHPDRWSRHAARVVVDHLDGILAAYERGEHLLRLRHTGGDFEDIRDIFDQMDQSTQAGWENVVERMGTMAQPLEAHQRTLEEGRRRGLMVSKRQTRSNIDQARHVAGPHCKWLRLLPQVEAVAPALTSDLENAITKARAAASSFADYLEETYLPAAPEVDGVGAERYIAEADRFVGLQIDPAEIYAWGWEEVHRLLQEMTEAARRIDPSLSLAEVIDLLETDPAYAAPSQEAFVEVMQQLQDEALHQLEGVHFDVPAQIRKVTVNLVPPGGPLGAYYLAPTEDFTRPGGIWYSFGDRPTIPLWGEVSTAYHEGFPGHHLQAGTVMCQADNLSRYHRLLVWYSGYGEGWALYTERLMDELGYLDRPEYLLGMLAAQQLRSCRVVIDLGSHLGYRIPEGAPVGAGEVWSFDHGVEMLHRVAGLPRDVSESEMIRYLGWPGQAISYKVGERAILDLRQQQRQKLGPAFDLKDFHRTLLGYGEIRLDYLAELTAGD
ncbi:MAG TPA: DUF885 domain-containing protein [Acidimicrobiia bacterium]|nr:DUF885 domain-containing protein [Acidimicrobiia bacterium]